MIERDGRVYSSLPLGAGVVNGRLEVRRLRQEVSPDGTLTETGSWVTRRYVGDTVRTLPLGDRRAALIGDAVRVVVVR